MGKRSRPGPILIAEDDPEDRMLTTDALAGNPWFSSLRFVEDGEVLLDYLHHRGKYAEGSPRPGLILLDLNMPKKDGRQVLREIKASSDLRRIPVVVLTSSRAEEDIFKSYDLGANSYITKPVKFQSLVDTMKILGQYWLETVELPPPGGDIDPDLKKTWRTES